MQPDSTNPSQEVETWTLFICPDCDYDSTTTQQSGRACLSCAIANHRQALRVEVMPVEDHQRLLLAEEQKRSESDKERLSLTGDLARLLGPVRPPLGVTHNAALIAAVSQLLIDKEAAESRLSSVEAERDEALSGLLHLGTEIGRWEEALTEDAVAAEHLRDKARADDDTIAAAVHAASALAYRAVIQLLRDKGIEQAKPRPGEEFETQSGDVMRVVEVPGTEQGGGDG